MEDAHTTILQLEPETDRHISFFAVYDGHGGSFAANYAGANLWKNLRSNSEFKEGRFIEALTRGFHETDSKLRAG
jgi:protein phosphatase 2C family protein 2/3